MKICTPSHPVGSHPHRQFIKVRWDCRKAACVRPDNQTALSLAFLGSHGSHLGFAVHTTATKKKQDTQLGILHFGAGGGTPRPKCRRKRRLASECACGRDLTQWVLVLIAATQKAPLSGYFCFGAGGGTRTHMMLPSADFESATSTNSITPAY